MKKNYDAPDHGRPLLAVAAALLLCAALAAPVGAYEETLSEGSEYYSEISVQGSSDIEVITQSLMFRDIEQFSGLEQYTYASAGFIGTPITNYSRPYDYSDVEFYISGKYIGSGFVETYNQYDLNGNGVAVVTSYTIQDWDISEFTGYQRVSIVFGNPEYDKVGIYRGASSSETGETAIYGGGTGPSGYCYLTGEYMWKINNIWKNTLAISNDDEHVSVSLKKYDVYPSKFEYVGQSFMYGTLMSYDDVFLTYPSYDLPITCSILSPSGRWYNRTYGEDGVSEQSDFSLSLSSDTASVGDSITATLVPLADAPRYDEIQWQHIGLDGRDEAGYVLNDTGWYLLDYSVLPPAYVNTTDDPHVFNFSAYWITGTPETDSVFVWVYNEGSLVAELKATLAISQGTGSSSILAVVVIDYSGGSTPILTDATVTCEDTTTGSMIPQSGSDSTFSRFQVVKGRLYRVTGSYDGYVSSSRTIRPTSDRETLEIYLTQNATVSVPENSTQVDFRVVDTSNVAVEDALITLTDQSTSQTYTGLTNAYGTRTFVVEAGHLYKFTVSKTGYTGVSGVVDPSIPGTRTVCIAPTSTSTGTNTTDNSDNTGDYHEMVDDTLNQAQMLVPGIFSFALMMLFLCLVRRGGK